MARTRLEIIIEAQNQAKRQLDGLSDQLKRLSGTQQDLAANTQQGSLSFGRLTASFVTGQIAAQALSRAFSVVTRATRNFISASISTSLSVERINATLPILAKNTGRTEKEIKRIILAIREENKSLLEATEITRGIILAGLDEVDALKLVAVARDIGATVGRSSADVNRLILESFQTLNPSMLKQLGINISLRKVYEDFTEQTGKVVSELTTTERQIILLNAIMGEGAKFAGAYDAAMETAAKKLGSLKDASVDILNVTGDLITAGFAPITQQLLDMVRQFRAWAFVNDNELRPSLQKIREQVGDFLVLAFNTLVAAVRNVIKVFQFLLPGFKFLIGDTDNLKILMVGLTAVIVTLIAVALAPLVIIVGAVTLAVLATIVVIRVIRKVITEIIATILIAIDTFTNWRANVEEFKNGALVSLNDFKSGFMNIWNAILDFFTNIWDSIKNVVSDAIGFIERQIDNIINKIVAIPQRIGGILGTIGGAIGGVVGLQAGGIVTRPTLATIGEGGPEAVIPLNRLGALGGGGTFNITIQNAFSDDADKLGREVGDAILRRLNFQIRVD